MSWFFTADPHFNHTNIIKYCDRPFKTIEEMNESLIGNWNGLVRTDDTTVIAGDLGFGDMRPILQRLNGKKILVIGSHDKRTVEECSDMFESIERLLDLHIYNQHVVVCHYAMRRWPRSHYGSWHMYAHSHGELEPIGKSWDVGVDNNNYYPLSWARIVEIMRTRPDNQDTHRIRLLDSV